MQFERFIAKRFLPKDRDHFSGPLVRIATYSIALGVLVMILSVSILHGFQKEISRKVVGFGSHIVVRNFDQISAYEESPISTQRPEISQIRAIPNVRHVQFFANKGGMIKTDDQIHGFIMKGVDPDFDTSFFAESLVEGRLFALGNEVSNEVIISKNMSDKLNLEINDKLRTYFWQGDSYRARAFTIVGIYNTDLTNFDEHYIIGDLRQIQRLNGWDSNQVAGYEILIDDFGRLDATLDQVVNCLDFDLNATSIIQENPSLFSWLDLLDSNIILILSIMAIVCVVSIVSSLLIMIFEKTSMIGILKAMGADNMTINKIFFIKASRIILKGIMIGNLVALLLSLIQYKYNFVKLDSNSYSMSTVPVDLDMWIYLSISLFTTLVCIAALLLPTTYITKIDPAKTMKVE